MSYRGEIIPPWQQGGAALLLGPTLLYITVFLALPFVFILVLSFQTHSPSKIWVAELTLANYQRLLDGFYGTLFWRTMRIGGVTTLLCFVLGFPLGYALARAGPRAKAVGLFLLVTPLMVSAVIRTFGWLVILGRNGVLNRVLAAFDWGPMSFLYTEPAVVLGLVSVMLPFMVLPIMAAIERVPISLEEAARNLGATWWAMMCKIMLPQSVPGIASGGLLVYSASISAYVTPALMGGSRVRLVGQQIYDETLVSYNWPGASALGWVLVIVTALLLASALRIARHRV